MCAEDPPYRQTTRISSWFWLLLFKSGLALFYPLEGTNDSSSVESKADLNKPLLYSPYFTAPFDCASTMQQMFEDHLITYNKSEICGWQLQLSLCPTGLWVQTAET